MAAYRILFTIVTLVVGICLAVSYSSSYSGSGDLAGFPTAVSSETSSTSRSSQPIAETGTADITNLSAPANPSSSSSTSARNLAIASLQEEKPTDDSTPQETVAPTDGDYARHIAQLKESLSDNSFTVILQKPFVVIGNETPDVVQQRATRTVKWAVDRLKQRYFEKDPNKIINIWLMKDKPSYEEQCLKIVKYRPNTPYGFYSSSHNVLMMNIATGGGTMVHEIVHPFIETNFPDCPSWFNEDLASLYEQSSSNQDDQIIGMTNWRLRGLQLAIKDDRVPSFKTLCETTTNQFYREDPGTNYSQARYLCYYLQQKGKLETFYHTFVKESSADPSGYKTLQKVLDNKDMQQFKADWQDYVMQLRFR